jgi:hypothetical protein
MAFLALAKFSEIEIETNENAKDIDEHGKERTRKACNPCKDNLSDRQLIIKEAIPFLRL